MRRAGIIVGVVVVGTAMAVMFFYPRLLTHSLELRAYFQNAHGLRAGAPVRLAGVEVGRVTSVRARPEINAAPAEVQMKLQTPYELSIPNDSTVFLATAGLLGETFVEIDVAKASGSPIKNGEVLKERPTTF